MIFTSTPSDLTCKAERIGTDGSIKLTWQSRASIYSYVSPPYFYDIWLSFTSGVISEGAVKIVIFHVAETDPFTFCWYQYWSCDTYQKTEWKVHINDIHRISAMRRDLCSSLFIYIPYIKISHPIRTMLFWSVSPAMSREWLSVVWYCQLLGYHTVQIWPEFFVHISNPLKHTCACRYIYSEGNVFLKTSFSTVPFHFIGIYITLHWI